MTDFISNNVFTIGDNCFLVLASGEVCLFSANDYQAICGYRWRSQRSSRTNVYAAAMVLDEHGHLITSITMHRLLMQPSKGLYVDHINGCGLDNRRENLRNVTPGQNRLNRKAGDNYLHSVDQSTIVSSRFIGVSQLKKSDPTLYRSYINSGGKENAKQHWLGYYSSEEEAARVRDSAALYLFGERARLNFKAESIEPRSPAQLRYRFRKRANSTSQYLGVARNHIGQWRTIIYQPSDGSPINVGTYDSEIEAAMVFDATALWLGRDRLHINFPESLTVPAPPEILLAHLARSKQNGYFGVSRLRNMSIARIQRAGVVYTLSHFRNTIDAARAYDGMARFFGEESRLNFPSEKISPIDATNLATRTTARKISSD